MSISYLFTTLLVLLSLLASGCGTGVSSATVVSCTTLTGTPWTPNVPGVSASNHDASVTTNTTVLTATGPVIGWAQGYTAAKEISVTIDMTQDLGPSGSLSLVGQVSGFPGGLSGGAYAYLVSLNDGTNEYINLSQSGASGDCAQNGFYNSDGTVNTSCTVSWPSAYANRSAWEQRQGFASVASKTPSVNVFPTCNWTSGSSSDPTGATNPECAFNTNFFPTSPTPSRLRYGGNYTAKYILMADSYPTVPSGTSATLSVTVLKKFGPNTTIAGAVDLNVIVVGNTNIQASRSAQGQQNLNTMLSMVNSWLSQSAVNIKLGTVNSVEWNCLNGGDAYAHVGVSQINNAFLTSGTLAPAATSGKALNVFLVENIKDDSAGADANLTILGIDGAIGAPPMHGTTESGMVVSTFDLLGTFNAKCPLGTGICSSSQIDSGFFEFAETVVHEMGHGLNQNHLGERNGKTQDDDNDTPVCTATDSSYGGFVSVTSCRTTDTNIFAGNSKSCRDDCSSYGTYSSSGGQYCPKAAACPYNYVMWWTTKHFKEGTGASDGDMFSAEQGIVMRLHPLIQ